MENTRNFQDQFPPTTTIPSLLQDWKDASDQLATWTMTHLVNRSDAWGFYYNIGPNANNATKKGELSIKVLSDHFMGINERIGLHSYGTNGMGKWLCIDIDAHGEPNPENWHKVCLILQTLMAWEITPIIEHTNGRYGFHIWILFDRKIECGVLHSIGRYLTATDEVFPKQVNPTEYGNYVRLPGRHHKNTTWCSDFFDSKVGVWHRGKAGIQLLLDSQPNNFDVVPDEARQYVVPVVPKLYDGTGNQEAIYDWSDFQGAIKTLDILQLSADRLTGKKSGNAHEIICPWNDQHTTGDTGTTVFVNDDGWPGFKCLHSHCEHKTLRDYLSFYGAEKVDACCGELFKKHDVIPDADVSDHQWGDIQTVTKSAEYIDPFIDEDDYTPKDHKEFKKPKLDFFTADQAFYSTPPKYLIKQHIMESTVNMLGGESTAGKSFYAISMCMAVATGQPMFGRFKVKRGKVVYMAGEGQGAIEQRLHGWQQWHETTSRDFVGIKNSFDLADPEQLKWFLDELPEILNQEKPKLVVIDTLSKYTNGNDVDPEVVGALIRGCLEYAKQHSTAFLIVHHLGKDKSKGLRGHSSLKADVDGVLMLERRSEAEFDAAFSSKMVCDKSKDDAPFVPYLVNFQPIALMMPDGLPKLNEDREHIRTVVCNYGREIKDNEDRKDKISEWLHLLIDNRGNIGRLTKAEFATAARDMGLTNAKDWNNMAKTCKSLLAEYLDFDSSLITMTPAGMKLIGRNDNN